MMFLIPKFSEKLIDKGGNVSREWYRWLSLVWSKLGYSKDLPLYKHVFVDGNAMDYDGQHVLHVPIFGGASVVAFPENEINAGSFTVRIPDNYKVGSDILVYVIHGALVDSGNVVWELVVGIIPDLGVPTFDGAVVTDATGDPTTDNRKFQILKITGGVQDKNTCLTCGIFRNGTEPTDTLENPDILFGVLFVFQIEGVGTND
jgi:hypothetical protein